MAYTYEWTLDGLTKSNHENLNDVIVGTRWQVKATDENGSVAVFTGATPFRPADINIDEFTDFQNLTQEQVIGWVQTAVSSSYTGYWDHISERLKKSIDAINNQKVDVNWNAFPWYTGSLTGSTV
jgi:hypothetical protein